MLAVINESTEFISFATVDTLRCSVVAPELRRAHKPYVSLDLRIYRRSSFTYAFC
jgi:hypothetical protein